MILFLKDHKLHELKLEADHARGDPRGCLASVKELYYEGHFS